jgi:hypothetical protein
MEPSPHGLMALTAGGFESPIIGAPLQDLNGPTFLGPTCAGLRWKTPTILAFAYNPDGHIRTIQYDLVTGATSVLHPDGFNDLFAGGNVAAGFGASAYWDTTGYPGRAGGNQRAFAVDDASGSIAVMKADRSGIVAYVGPETVPIVEGFGNYGGCFRDRVLHVLAPGKRMYRWSLDTRTVEFLFDLPPWVRPICQFSGGWFLSWHDNLGGVVIWSGTDLEHGRIVTQGINAFDPRIIRVGDEIHVLYSSGAGELLHEGQRRILPLNDLDQWPPCNLLSPSGYPDPPVPPDPPIPPVPPDPPVPPIVETAMFLTVPASMLQPYWEWPATHVVVRGVDGQFLVVNRSTPEADLRWIPGQNHQGGGLLSGEAWQRTSPTTLVAERNGLEYRLSVDVTR